MNMAILQDDYYYKVPDFRQVDFFSNKRLDQNISLLRKNINRINYLNERNNTDYYVETKETKSGSSNLPAVDSQSIESSERGSGIRSSSHYSAMQRISSPLIKLKTEEEKNMRFEYNKIFSKKYQKILENDRGRRETKSRAQVPKSNYVKDKIEEMRSKIFFIKSVYDYTYPQIMVQKLKTMKGITNKIRNKTIELEAQKIMKKPETDLDRLVIRGQAFKVENEEQLINLSKNVYKRKKNTYKFFKT